MVIRPSFVIRISTFVILSLISLAALSAPDDEVVTGNAGAPVQERVVLRQLSFDQRVFPGASGAAAGLRRLESQVKLRVAEINRVCQLSETQRQKLELAGQGDLRRFMSRVEDVRHKFEAMENDRNALWPDIQPLQQKFIAGLTGPDDLVTKVLPRTLSPQQAAQYEQFLLDRSRFRYRTAIAASLSIMESSVALKHAQREALTTLLLEETQPPKAFGPYDYYLVIYRLSTLPETRIQPLVDDRQWQALQQLFDQHGGKRQMLIDKGVIDGEEAP